MSLVDNPDFELILLSKDYAASVEGRKKGPKWVWLYSREVDPLGARHWALFRQIAWKMDPATGIVTTVIGEQSLLGKIVQSVLRERGVDV
jgi:hypothetical protein